MLEVMRTLEVEVPWHACSESYSISVATIRESRRLVAEGCSGTSSYECPAQYYATLLAPEALAHLTAAQREAAESRVAIDRWENEGGADPSSERLV